MSNFEREKRAELSTETLIDIAIAWPWLYSSADAIKGAEDVLDTLKEAINSPNDSILNGQLVLACTTALFLTTKQFLNQIKKEDIEKFLE